MKVYSVCVFVRQIAARQTSYILICKMQHSVTLNVKHEKSDSIGKALGNYVHKMLLRY